MSLPAPRPARYEDLFDLPENVVGEIINGTLYTQPRPAGPHAFVASGLSADLGSPFGRGRGGPGGWVFAVEPELHLGHDIFVPDLAAWRTERMPAAERAATYFTTAPDWIAEIACPSTTQRDRLLKVPAYARYGVSFLWLVEPTDGRVEAYGLDAGRWIWLGTWADEREARIEPFDAVPLDLIQLWESTGLRG